MRWLLASIFIFHTLGTWAQLPGDIKFTNYTRDSGLPEESINNVLQDSRGFIWAGSREGLMRFDGQHFKTWYANPADSSKFSNNNIHVVGEYKTGHMLFLSGSRLWEVNINNHRFSQPERFKEKTIIVRPLKLSEGYWYLSEIDTFFILSNTFAVLHRFPVKKYFQPNTLVAAFPLCKSYALLSGVGIQQFYLFNYITGTITPIQIKDPGLDSRSRYLIPAIYDSTIQRLYMTAYFNGNYYIDLELPTTKTSYAPVPIPLLKDGSIRKSILLHNGRILQAGDNGLYITDMQTLQAYVPNSKLDKPPASSIMVDIFESTDGSFWLSTTRGISRFSLSNAPVNYWRNELKLEAADEFKSIINGTDGNLYYLTRNKSLSVLNTGSGLSKRLDSAVYFCWSAVISGDDIYFSGAGRKIGKYNCLTRQTSYPAFLQPFYTNNTDLVTLVFAAKNGDMWYSCNGGGGLVRNPAGTNQYIQYSRLLTPPSFSHSYVHSAAEDSDGNIWWGNNKTNMLLRWDAARQQFDELPVETLIPAQKFKTGISNLYIDKADNLWIALDAAALLKYDLKNKKGSYYDINKGLPTDAVYAMCSDSKNRMWLGTRKGLCCYLPDRDMVITFTRFDGFPEDDFEGYGIQYDEKKNLVYAGGKQTLSYFNPDTLLNRAISFQPPVYIDEMLVNGKTFYFDDEKNIRLGTKENNIELSFAVPDFDRNTQLVFQYQLKGNSNKWIDLGDKRTVTFNGLLYGKYTLSVRCRYKGTDRWKETDHPFTFTIETPLTKTLWFRLLVLLAVAGLAWYIIRNYYRRKLERQQAAAEKIQAVEKERTRIATDMHDDFGASLSRIKFISVKMQLTQKENEGLKTDLSKISDYSDEMAEKMNEIVWALNQRYDSLGDLVSFCRSYSSEYLQDKNIKLIFEPGQLSEQKIQGEVRRNIFLVIKEALHNIVKHAHATEVSIAFSQNKHLHVSIYDNGKGIDMAGIRPFANGLENMKKRMQDINGTFSIENKEGTRIDITVEV